MVKSYWFIVLGLLLMPLVLGIESLPNSRAGDCINLPQICNCTYVNLTSITYPNQTKIIINQPMTKIGQEFNYTYCLDSQTLGEYTITTCGDDNGVHQCKPYTALVSTRGINSLFFLIFIYSLAIVFFIATLIVDEEFLVYISGVLFLVGGIYIMINGLDNISDWYTRTISYVSLGIGILFTIGAYTFNRFSQNSNEYSDEE